MFFDTTTAGQTSRIEVREAHGRYLVIIGERRLDLDLVNISGHDVSVLVDGISHDLTFEETPEGFAVMVRGDRFEVDVKDAVKDAAFGKVIHKGPLKLTAPMPGKIVRILVGPGDSVEAGQGILVMEAMKMENELKAARTGMVLEIMVKEGQTVEAGASLLVVG